MIDYEIRKQLEEAWLCEMAMTRKDAVRVCDGIHFQLIVHIAKCFLFQDSNWYEHWLREAAGFCLRCDDIRLKPKAKRPDPSFFMEDEMICEDIETISDAKLILDFAISRCSELSHEESSNKEAINFMKMWNTVRVDIAEKLADEETYDRSTYMEIIDNAMKYIKR